MIAEDWKKVTGFFLGTCMALMGIFVLTSDHAEHEVKRASEAERTSLILNEGEGGDGSGSAGGVGSPVIVRPAGMRQSIGCDFWLILVYFRPTMVYLRLVLV